jgi:hypothetical protein
MVDTVTGGILATLTADPSGVLPRPLTQDPNEPSAIVRSYLVGTGIPADEVSGTHVTTTMAGGGPTGCQGRPGRGQNRSYFRRAPRRVRGKGGLFHGGAKRHPGKGFARPVRRGGHAGGDGR